MNTKNINLTILFLIISLASLFLILWLIDYSGFGLPTMLPTVEIRTYGILILIAFTAITYLYQWQLLKVNPETSILKLVLLSTFIILISLLVYQAIRQTVILHRPFSSQILSSAIVPAFVFVFLAASAALSLKKVKGFVRQIPLILLIILVLLTKKYITIFEW